MTDTAPPPAPSYVRRIFSILGALATFIGNAIPLYGVLYWQWDTFQLLILYWMETVIIAFWTMMRLSRLSADERGEITVNGRARPATAFSLVGFYSLHAGVFITVHMIFLWGFFSREWLEKLHGAASLFAELFVVNYAWVALVFLFIASGVSFLIDGALAQRQPSAGQAKAAPDPVGTIVDGLYARIIIMQIAIIFGAIISGMSGSLAPLVIMIIVKTLIDVGAATVGQTHKKIEYSAKSKKLEIEM